jgi:TonB family protein
LKPATFSPFVRSAVLMVLMGCFAVNGIAEERKAKSEIKPAYPELAKKMNLSGVVKVQVEISPTGTVTSAKALGGHPVFIDSALDAVRKWRFEPAQGASQQTVEFKFVNPNQ